MTTDTIIALSSAPGRAGVAVYRVSGPEALRVGRTLAGSLPDPRRAGLRTLRDATGEVIDDGVVLVFPAPKSFTGEDVVELQLHGSTAVADALFAAALSAGARLAERGEFARRAVANGRIDLAEAEGIADLIDAETETQRRQALAQMGGALSARAEDWRGRLIAAAAPLEAAIDFPDEGDVPEAIAERAEPVMRELLTELEEALRVARRARAMRDGVSIALIGAPNAGKSSLFNALVGHEAAIVTNTPGTTRDVLEARLDLGGVLAIVADTAGDRDATDLIEAEGVRRARARASDADIRVRVLDGAEAREARESALAPTDDLVVLNKTDLSGDELGAASFGLSATTGAGLDPFLSELARRASDLVSLGDAPALTRARHAEAVRAAQEALERGLDRLQTAPELAAEDVRLAARHLARITGAVDVEDVLDAIFAGFCIGK